MFSNRCFFAQALQQSSAGPSGTCVYMHEDVFVCVCVCVHVCACACAYVLSTRLGHPFLKDKGPNCKDYPLFFCCSDFNCECNMQPGPDWVRFCKSKVLREHAD